MQRHTLPDGGWADIRSKEEVNVRGRRGVRVISGAIGDTVLRALAKVETTEDYEALGLTEEQIDLIQRTQEATVVALLAGWSYDEPLPTLANIGDLGVTRYDALVAIAAPDGAEMALDTNPTPEPDPKALTGS